MACGFSQPWMSQTVGASSSKVITARSGGADWRCVEINTDVPARITLAWSTDGPLEPQVTCDVARTQRFYVYAQGVDLHAQSLGTASVVSVIISQVPGPQPVTARRSRRLPVGSYDSTIGADDIAVPPFATRLLVEPSSASGTVEVTLSDAASALAFYTDATMPSAGIELAGATQVQVVVGTAPARLTWILEM